MTREEKVDRLMQIEFEHEGEMALIQDYYYNGYDWAIEYVYLQNELEEDWQ